MVPSKPKTPIDGQLSLESLWSDQGKVVSQRVRRRISVTELAYRLEVVDGFRVTGLSVPITSSQAQNAVICQRFWRTFNSELSAAGARQHGSWRKYAITYAEGETYHYMCGIPDEPALPSPTHFKTCEVPAGLYLVFDHVGPMNGITATLSTIYRRHLPKLGFKASPEFIFHFERYDHRFRWNHPKSVIEIWVPVVE